MGRVFFRIILVLSVFSGEAIAQINAYENQMEGLKNRELNGPQSPNGDMADSDEEGEAGMLENARLNSRDNCFMGFCVPGFVSEDTVPGRREVSLSETLGGTFAGMADLMTSTEIPDLSQTNMGSLGNAYETTLYLTESAVAAGIHNNFMKTSVMANSLELSHLNSQITAMLDDDMKPFVKAYRWCIQNKMRDGFYSRYQAMTACRDERPDLLGIGEINFPISPGSGGMILGDDRDHDLNNPGMASLSGAADIFTLRLTDIVFNQEGLGASLLGMRDFKDSFRDLFGDIEYGVEELSFLGLARNGSFEVVLPTRTIAAVLRERTVAKLDALGGVIADYCGLKVAGFVDVSREWEAIASGVSTPGSAISTISVPGFRFSRSHYNLFTKLFDAEVGGSPGVTDCVLTAPPAGWDLILDGVIPFLADGIHGKMYKYAYALTLMEAVLMGDLAYRSIENLSIGSRSMTPYQDAAKGLVFRTLGISEDESSRVYQEYSNRLVTWLEDEAAKLENKARGAQAGVGVSLETIR